MKREGELGVLCHKFWTYWKPLNTVKEENVSFLLEKRLIWTLEMNGLEEQVWIWSDKLGRFARD